MQKEPADIRGFHAHIYYERASRDAAARVREGLDRKSVV